jgi:hypothetical protein
MEVKYSLSLTKEEKTPVFFATKLANPDADSKAFRKAYRIALWKADSLKRGISPGDNWEAVDFSPFPDTDSEDSSGESSTSSEDGMQVIREDLLRQKQVPSSSSPLENKYLAGFMKSPEKLQPDAQAKQALDKDFFSLISPLKQADISAPAEEQVQRAGDVTERGGSMSAHHGSPSLDLPAIVHLAGMQSAADIIRARSTSSASQPADASRINSDISVQVNKGKESNLQRSVCLAKLSASPG